MNDGKNAQPLTALVVEGDPAYADLLVYQLSHSGYELRWTRIDTEPAFLASLRAPLDVIFSDFSMPNFSGLRALELLRSSGLDVPLILVSGTAGEESAVEAMRFGATDYFLKHDTARLPNAVKRALNETQLRAEQRRTMEALRNSDQRLRSIIDHTMDCIMVLTLAGVVSEMNHAGLAMLQAPSLADAQKSSFFDYILPAYRQRFLDLHERVLKGKSELLEFEILGLLGRRRWLEIHASPLLDANQCVESSICITRDITERKQSEQQLTGQLEELQRWSAVTLGREDRVLALKNEVNGLLEKAGLPPRYTSLDSRD